MKDINPLLGIGVAIIVVGLILYKLYVKVIQGKNKSLKVHNKISDNNDQKVLDIIVAITDVYKGIENNKVK